MDECFHEADDDEQLFEVEGVELEGVDELEEDVPTLPALPAHYRTYSSNELPLVATPAFRAQFDECTDQHHAVSLLCNAASSKSYDCCFEMFASSLVFQTIAERCLLPGSELRARHNKRCVFGK